MTPEPGMYQIHFLLGIVGNPDTRSPRYKMFVLRNPNWRPQGIKWISKASK